MRQQLADFYPSREAENGRGCVKTFRAGLVVRAEKNRAATQILGLLTNQTLGDFT